MYDTLADHFHNYSEYFNYSWEEFIGWVVTSFFAAFIFTFNDWGIEEFSPGVGLRSLVVMAIFLFFIFAFTTTLLKLFAMRFGYQIYYQPHLLGLMAGLVICVASAGYLPIFLPGGFKYHKPVRQYVGHWRGYHRPWEVAMISGGFPLLLLFWALLLNRIYLSTGSELVVGFIIAMCLTAIYSMIPLPNVALEYGGRVLDFFRYLKGMTFGLDVYMNSRVWYVPLTFFTLFMGALTWAITISDYKVALWMWVVTMILCFIILWLYKIFWEQTGGYQRH